MKTYSDLKIKMFAKGRGAFSDFTSVPTIKSIKTWYLGLQTIFVIKPFLARAARSLTVLNFKALAVLVSDLPNSGYVKQHNVALPFSLVTLLFGIYRVISLTDLSTGFIKPKITKIAN